MRRTTSEGANKRDVLRAVAAVRTTRAFVRECVRTLGPNDPTTNGARRALRRDRTHVRALESAWR